MNLLVIISSLKIENTKKEVEKVKFQLVTIKCSNLFTSPLRINLIFRILLYVILEEFICILYFQNKKN